MLRSTRARDTRHMGAPSLLLVGALVLGGCGGGDDSPQPPGEATATADGTSDETTGTEPEPDEEEDEGTAPPPRTDMTAEDGFNGPLDVDHDHAPGTGELTFGDERIAMTVDCIDHTRAQDRLFFLEAHGEGEDAEGNRTTAQAQREITREPDRFYDYGGQEQGMLLAGRFVDGMFHSHAVASPADNDRTGANLPIVRVDEDGRFSAVADFPAMNSLPHAPQGEVVFTGRCQADWPGPIVDAS